MATQGRPALSARERQLLKLASGGLKDAAIASRLDISEATVKTYWRRIRAKLGHNSRTELVATLLRGEIERTLADARDVHTPSVANPADSSFYKLLLEQAPDAILIVSTDGTIRMLNETAAELFGWASDDLVGRHIRELVPERYWTEHAQHVEDYFESPSKRAMGDHLSTTALLKSGAEIKIAANLAAIGDGEGRSVICVVRPMQGQK